MTKITLMITNFQIKRSEFPDKRSHLNKMKYALILGGHECLSSASSSINDVFIHRIEHLVLIVKNGHAKYTGIYINSMKTLRAVCS